MLGRFHRAFIRVQFTQRERLEVYEKLRAAAEDGIQLKAAIDNLYDICTRRGKKPNHPMGVILSEWSDAIAAGRPFHEAVGDWIPSHERMVLAGAAKGQTLLGALDAITAQILASHEIRTTLRNASLLPMLYLILSMGLFAVVAKSLLPELRNTVSEAEISDAAGLFVFLADGVATAPWIMPLVLVALIYLVKMLMPLEFPLRRKLDGYVPFAFYRLLQGSSFLLTLAGLTKVGVQQVEALRMLAQDGSPWLRARCNPVIDLMSEGKELGDALDQSGYKFPSPKIIDDLMFYESTSKSKLAIERAAQRWLKEGIEQAKAIAASMQLASIGVFALMLLWIVYNVGAIVMKSSIFTSLQ